MTVGDVWVGVCSVKDKAEMVLGRGDILDKVGVSGS